MFEPLRERIFRFAGNGLFKPKARDRGGTAMAGAGSQMISRLITGVRRIGIRLLLAVVIAVPARANDMQGTMTNRQMTSDQQAQLLRFTEVGLKWAAGQITFDDVIQRLGKPQYQSEQIDLIKYAYYQNGVMSMHFVYDKLKLVDGKPRIAFVEIEVSNDVRTNIPYEHFESLGLHRLVRGETIDGIRRETRHFFSPTGALEIPQFHGKNYVTFGYRLPMPRDSLFDVTAGFSYDVKWIDDSGPPALHNIRKAENLRGLGISRHYLTPKELEQRRQATQWKY
ncbi:hypothetical protein F3J20_23860 [Paraburkholderia sp. Cy-641]|uniref:hypothetical protein n=1 Tax=Paraburkholderia sp. Cy-641 TaxID=2608337 RepID=UPI0014218B98|nr:hypothetical protein [Paraburkholderia sp. Cy-641]NIF80397.1 hypothetical protein [Paraburkholderia sp. Cy-641]